MKTLFQQDVKISQSVTDIGSYICIYKRSFTFHAVPVQLSKQTQVRRSSCPARTLQRINSQEALDFHETSSGSDQSELCGEDGMVELELDNPRSFAREILLSPEEMTTKKQFRFQPAALGLKPRGRLSCRAGVRVRSSSKVTVPKPFQMMLREEERKRHKVRTRSEIELENTLLKRELEELRECQKKFRASPAPAHIHLPLYEIISRRPSQGPSQGPSQAPSQRPSQGPSQAPSQGPSQRPSQRPSQGPSQRPSQGPSQGPSQRPSQGPSQGPSQRPSQGRSYSCNHDSNVYQASAAISPEPFHFLERERRKREAKIVAELGNVGQKEERQAFRARPVPSSVYGTKHRAGSKTSKLTQQKEATEGQSDPNSEQEPDSSPDSCGPQRSLSSKPAKKQIELSIEMVKESDRSYTGDLCSPRLPDDGDCISL
ncbi:uncharacterized protein C2orf16-like isoform X2 [Scophthalmus maximus]|uniref:uncharacterized protein C2orf16-like isoform X2 n=1 Tax=Scophthalmus maximus TaxID=52904 RepID=UPI001FA93B36|nr:uncharacterized protein C2orf16-like isoform X2 [Scophthalmus maximus]